MTDVSDDGEINCCPIQRASGGGPAYPAAATAAGVLSNPAGFIGRTSGVTLQDRPGQHGYKVTVFLLADDRGASAGSSALRRIGGAFFLRPSLELVSHCPAPPLS